MNKRKQMTFAAITAVAITTFAAAKPAVTVTASLRDGSTIRGDFLTKKITGETFFEKNLVLAPFLVRSINFSGTNGESKVELSNGDHFAMTVLNDVFAVRSVSYLHQDCPQPVHSGKTKSTNNLYPITSS